MKLMWIFVVILAAAIGMAAGYRLGLAREHQRLEKNARAEDKYVLVLAQTKAAHATDEQVAECKVEESP